MNSRSPNAIAIDIEEEIRAEYLSSHARVFWPEQFVDARIGSQEDVLDAIRVLATTGKVRVLAELHCPNGHQLWEGPPEELSTYTATSCPYCGAGLEDDGAFIYLHIRANDEWLMRLDRETRGNSGANLKKKA
ncbi:hypothetical protein WME98_40380 [Sorangium sp. So ce296]|uniref:hypothetical protein n=1 Tax=Sorangium sp. So ce296 TaxID=3133296 RepID=UPI003F5E3883